jgi:acyl-coenzyme A synthetase/AMP-(fatty) acid ligase
LDAVLLAHPAVGEAIAFGAPDPMYGQAVHAALVLRAGHTPSPKLTQDIQVCSAVVQLAPDTSTDID